MAITSSMMCRYTRRMSCCAILARWGALGARWLLPLASQLPVLVNEPLGAADAAAGAWVSRATAL